MIKELLNAVLQRSNNSLYWRGPETSAINRIVRVPEGTSFSDPSRYARECLVIVVAKPKGVRLAHINTDPHFMRPGELTGLLDELLCNVDPDSTVVVAGSGTRLSQPQQDTFGLIMSRIGNVPAGQLFTDEVGMIDRVEVQRLVCVDTRARKVIVRRFRLLTDKPEQTVSY